MPSTASRLLTLILLMQRWPNQKASDLARALDISVRTLHRDLARLDEMGIPVYSERGPYGGFSLVRGYRMPPLVFSPDEAAALAMGAGLVKEMWGPLYASAAQSAMAKLDNVLPDEQRMEVAWARRSLVATGLHRINLEDLTAPLVTLRRAARERRRVRMAYQSRSQSQPAERELDPYALVHRWGWWYVIGYCHRRQAVRTFRVDRIAGLHLLDELFDLPGDFDIQAFLASEQEFAQTPLTARLHFTPQAAAIARSQSHLWEQMEEQPDGSLLVTLATAELEFAASLALSFGPLVTVLEPPELRRKLRDWTLTTLQKYPEGE
jgi:predicted DNA-binding transcriptional regulator YafY